MQVWNISDKETDQLKLLGLVGVSANVNGELLKPGEGPRDVPPHARAELSRLISNGVLTDKNPNPPPEAQGPAGEKTAKATPTSVVTDAPTITEASEPTPPEPPPFEVSADESPRSRRK